MFSLFLGLLLPFSLGLYMKHRKFFWLGCSAAIFLADILTFSRGGYIGLLGGLAFISFWGWKKLGRKLKIASLLAVLTMFTVLFFVNPIAARFFSIFNFNEGSNLGRIEMWRTAVETIKEHPFFGTGIGNYPFVVNPLAGYREPIYAHNTYLDIAAETGILGGLAWIGLLAVSMTGFIKGAKYNKFYFCGAASLVIFSVHSLVETGIYFPAVLALTLIIISLSASIKITPNSAV
jgi:O-antigen ligase